MAERQAGCKPFFSIFGNPMQPGRRRASRARATRPSDRVCSAVQQSVEKATGAAPAAIGQEASGHVVTDLLEGLRPQEASIDAALFDRARALDKHYIPTRYSSSWSSRRS